jgi:SAM-dependent methyltransferase
MTAVSTIDSQYDFYFALLGREDPKSLLDAGCGKGRGLSLTSVRLPDVAITGIDNRPHDLREVPLSSVGLVVGDLRWLPFYASSFDAIFCRDVLESIREPVEALTELARVVKRGGVVLVCHWDWDTVVFNIQNHRLGRRLVNLFADTQQAWMEHVNPAMGRQLLGLVRSQQAFHVIDHGVVVLIEEEWRPGRFGHDLSRDIGALLLKRGVIHEAERDEWLSQLGEVEATGKYLYTANHYWCLARKVLET